MSESTASIYYPPLQPGLIIHLALLLALALSGGYGLVRASQADIGLAFLLSLAPLFLAIGLGPLMAYRAYALYTAQYTIEREGLRLRWGLRVEEIPINEVLWVKLGSELNRRLPLPWLRLPGDVVGVRSAPGLGEVEYLAAQDSPLVLIATRKRIYAISPEDPQAFLQGYQRHMEWGSLAPIAGRSVYPSFLINEVWSVPLARTLVLVGAGLSLLLLVWVSLAIPGREWVGWSFGPAGAPTELAPSVRLMLLPVLNAFLFLIDLLLGLFLFRREESQPLAMLVLGGGAVTPLLFLAGVFFILLST